MCGIAGFIRLGAGNSELAQNLNKMLGPINHRGPDDKGIWVDEKNGVALGHQRLSIIDLSIAGHQPMTSACARYVLIFNGEIYNHLELRSQLENSNHSPIYGWRGHSDTETLLGCISAWGIRKALQSTVGMFALAIWDRQESCLTLARDRIGEKPLYYGWQRDNFVFGSELKALKGQPSFIGDINWNSASTFLRLNYIPAPNTIYKNIYKLLPGTTLTLTQKDITNKMLPDNVPYWTLASAAHQGSNNPFKGSFKDAIIELEHLVRKAVQIQAVADVPVGAFLSGGIDSSVVVSMLKSATNSNITTFSIGMPDAKMDESIHAAAVAQHLGTRHVEHIIQPFEALDLIPRISEIWDEPFADSSQIPTFLVSQLAKKYVTVALSGDGGDEFFLGYSHYKIFNNIWRLRSFGALPWRGLIGAAESLTQRTSATSLVHHAKSVVEAWRQPNAQMLCRYWLDKYRNGSVPIEEQSGVPVLNLPLQADAASTAALWDAGTYLPDDVLVKVDRAAMANSLETRAPLLDHRIIEFSYTLPLEYKIHNGVSKHILRELLGRHVPREIVDRPKMGFSIPLHIWLKNELRPWVESLLDQIEEDSVFSKSAIKQLWEEHLSGRRNNSDRIWSVLMLIDFLRKR